jgi:hypothetical protein
MKTEGEEYNSQEHIDYVDSMFEEITKLVEQLNNKKMMREKEQNSSSYCDVSHKINIPKSFD